MRSGGDGEVRGPAKTNGALQVGPYPYNVDPESKVVLDGPYKGEVVSFCNDSTGTMRIPDVHLEPWMAEKVRRQFDLIPSDFHLDVKSPTPGTYCFPFKNPATDRHMAANMSCRNFGEWRVSRYTDPLIPFYEGGICGRVRSAIKVFAPHEEPGPIAKVADGTQIGAGFAIAAVIVDRVVKHFFGRSLIERARDWFRNGNGGTGGAAAGGAAGAAAAHAALPIDHLARIALHEATAAAASVAHAAVGTMKEVPGVLATGTAATVAATSSVASTVSRAVKGLPPEAAKTGAFALFLGAAAYAAATTLNVVGASMGLITIGDGNFTPSSGGGEV